MSDDQPVPPWCWPDVCETSSTSRQHSTSTGECAASDMLARPEGALLYHIKVGVRFSSVRAIWSALTPVSLSGDNQTSVLPPIVAMAAQKAADFDMELLKCWASEADGGPSLIQHWFLIYLRRIVRSAPSISTVNFLSWSADIPIIMFTSFCRFIIYDGHW